MQHSPEELKRSLISCIDEENNVTDMAACLVVISILEHTHITRKILEDTRLGKYVNDIRRKTGDQDLSKRLKNLVRKWRDTCQSESVNGVRSNRGDNSSNGRQSLSPPFSAPSSVRGVGSGLSPTSLTSSGNASPIRIVSAPTTPSTLPQKLKNLSNQLTTAKGALSAYTKGSTLSPRTSKSLPHSVSYPDQSKLEASAVFKSYGLSQSSNEPESSYTPSVEKVPRTNAANKRLRKDDSQINELPSSNKLKCNLSNGFDDECSRDSVITIGSNDMVTKSGDISCTNVPVTEAPSPQQPQKPPVRRSGRRRKRGQESHHNSSGIDPLRQKMAVIGAKSSKVKTTSELVAELAERKGDIFLARRASRLEEQVKDKDHFSLSHIDSVMQNKLEHMQRFLKSTPGPLIEDDDDDEITIIEEVAAVPVHTISTTPSPIEPPPVEASLQPNSPLSNLDLLGISVNDSAEEILARLPALDPNIIVWDELTVFSDAKNPEIMSDSEEDDDGGLITKLIKRSEKVEPSVIQALHSTNVEYTNGNFDMEGRFREWHEVMLHKSYQDTPLVMLPYVVTDF